MSPRLLASATLALSLLIGSARAQSCSTLAVSGTGAPGTALTFALTHGAANSFGLLVIGETTGRFDISFGPIGTLTLGLTPPFTFLPLGVTDAQGAVSLRVPVPNNFVGSIDLNGQGFTAEFQLNGGRPTIQFCTSNVVAFHVGT